MKMLLLSLLVALFSLGLSLAWVWWRVWRLAATAPAGTSRQGPLLVPGVRLQYGRPGSDFLLRLERAATLLAQGHPGPVFLLGGETTPGCGSEAAHGRDYLLARGIPGNWLWLEEHSRHTLENLRFVRHRLGDAEATVISNRYHLARLLALAKRLGMQLVPCAAEARLQLTPRTLFKLFREAFFLHWYYCGAIWARLVRDRQSLERIY